jgi:Flp pilus assembly protein TadG
MNTQGGSRTPACPEVSVELRPDMEQGQTFVEFAMSLPLILGLLLAITVFGIAFNNQLVLTAATTAGAQQLSISRGQTTDPCATTSQTVSAAAPNLTSGSLSYSIAFGTGSPVTYGTPYTGTSCTSAASSMVSGNTAKVTVTYPCNLTVPLILQNLTGWSPPSCTLEAQTAELIQ